MEIRYNKSIKELKKDKNILKQIIGEARKETDVTLTELADILDLSKTTIHKYCNKNL